MSFLGLRTSQLKCEVNKYLNLDFWICGMWLFVSNEKSETHRDQVECDGLLISFSFKLFILAIGTWAVFYRWACNSSHDIASSKLNLICQIWPHLSYTYILLKASASFFAANPPLPRPHHPPPRPLPCGLLVVLRCQVGQPLHFQVKVTITAIMGLIFIWYVKYNLRICLPPRLMEQRRKLQYTDLVRYASSFLDRWPFLWSLQCWQ